MSEKFERLLDHPLLAAFLKACVVTAAIFLAAAAVHLVLSLVFYGPKTLGVLYGTAIAGATYANYVYEEYSAKVVIQEIEETPDERV